MASRYSPGVLPDDEGWRNFGQDAVRGLETYFGMKRQNRLDKEAAEAAEIEKALAKGELYNAGIREGTRPHEEVEIGLDTPSALEPRDAFAGQGLGMQPPGGPRRSPLAQGLQAATAGGVARPTPAPTPELVTLPGAFDPQVGGFAARPVFAAPALPEMPKPRMLLPDPSTVQLTDQYFLDTKATPEAREQAQLTQQRSRLGSAIGQFRGMDPARAALAAELLEAGIPASIVFDDPGVSLEERVKELVATGKVPPEIAPLAARDATLARQYLAPPDADDPDAPFDPDNDVVIQRALEMERLRAAGQLPRSGAGGGGGAPDDAPSFGQAYDIVRNRYAVRPTPYSDPTGYSIPDELMIGIARRLARGEDAESIDWPNPELPTSGDQVESQESEGPGFWGHIRNFLRRGAENTARAYGWKEPGGAAAGASPPETVEQIRSLVREFGNEMSPTELRAYLREAGYSPEEIREALGG